MAECTCRDDCCLEIVPVTINNYTTSITGATLTLAQTTPTATTEQITASLSVAGIYDIKFWLQDAAVPQAQVSPVPPTDPGVSAFNLVTDATGSVTFTIENTGALTTWYLCATLGQGVTISEPISIGV